MASGHELPFAPPKVNPAARPQFLRVPNNVLRAPGVSWTTAIVYAADRYRSTYGRRLDAATLKHWIGMSRSTHYRELRKIEAFVDEDGYERKDVFDPKVGGWVKVLTEDIRELGPVRAIVLALFRSWSTHPTMPTVRADGSVRVLAKEVAAAAGLDEKTVRRAAHQLSDGSHLSARGLRLLGKAQRFLCRLELATKRGYASFVKLLDPKAIADRINRRRAEPRRAPPVVRAAMERPSEATQRALQSRQQADEDDEFDIGEWAMFTLTHRPHAALIGFIGRCRSR